MSFKKILIAIDSSPLSLEAAKKGFELAHELKAAIGLIFVVDRGKEVINADLGITPEQSQAVLLQQAEDYISQLLKMYNGINEIVKFTPEGFPKNEIIATASQWQADLLVMGTHGRTGLNHLLMGSVAEYVIRHAGIPVMVISKLKNDGVRNG